MTAVAHNDTNGQRDRTTPISTCKDGLSWANARGRPVASNRRQLYQHTGCSRPVLHVSGNGTRQSVPTRLARGRGTSTPLCQGVGGGSLTWGFPGRKRRQRLARALSARDEAMECTDCLLRIRPRSHACGLIFTRALCTTVSRDAGCGFWAVLCVLCFVASSLSLYSIFGSLGHTTGAERVLFVSVEVDKAACCIVVCFRLTRHASRTLRPNQAWTP